MHRLVRSGLAAALLAGAAQAQVMPGVDLHGPAMTEAELTREEVAARLASAPAGQPADLSRLRLNGLDLTGLDLAGVNLRAARLNGAKLAGVRLDGAELGQAWLLGADLAGASLRGAQLFQTQFGGADLDGADLSDSRAPADFTRANLTGASFARADLSADMRNQSMGLMRGVLVGAKADGADFSDALMMRTNAEFASLKGASLAGADLSRASLGGANLTGADVTGAVFDGADLASTRLIDLKGAAPDAFDSARNLARAFLR